MALTFAISSALGTSHTRSLAREFANVLYEGGFETVLPFSSYDELYEAMESGEADAAWGPPIVCARLEKVGGKVVLQASRQSSTSYRSALVCRANAPVSIEALVNGERGPLRATWVDEFSLGGYLLPHQHLHQAGVDFSQAFESEVFGGSYEQCLDDVLDCRADVTACYANARGLGYVDMFPNDAHHLRCFAYTMEVPNDGIVMGPKSSESAASMTDRFLSLMKRRNYREILQRALEVDELVLPGTQSYLQELSWAIRD